MKERDAISKGYSFSGFYSRAKEEATSKIAQEKALGNKAVLVEKKSPGRAGQIHYGWSVYVYVIESKENRRGKKIDELRRHLSYLESQRKRLSAELSATEEEIGRATAELETA